MELAIATLGVVLGAASLSWQYATHVLTGGRIRVELLIGALADDGRGMVTSKAGVVSPGDQRHWAEQGFGRPVMAARVSSIGRMPVTVVRWSLELPNGMALVPIGGPAGPPLLHRLDVGESQTWAVDMADVQAFLEAAKAVVKPRPAPPAGTVGGLGMRVVQTSYDARQRKGLVAVVELGDGRTVTSREGLAL
jgi:hypothetical protein